MEVGWKSAKNLIVITNGSLGLLPLGLLPTAPSNVNPDAQPYFAGYREVPWLARSHAVTMVPSARRVRTLRQLSRGSDKRQPMIGFGDPISIRTKPPKVRRRRSWPSTKARNTRCAGCR